jgi:hypothetical protein
MKRLVLISGLLLCAVALLGPAPVEGQEWRHIAVVISDASAGETALVVELLAACQEARRILVENREGTYREELYVRHVYGRNIILSKPLKQEFASGSRIYQ